MVQTVHRVLQTSLCQLYPRERTPKISIHLQDAIPKMQYLLLERQGKILKTWTLLVFRGRNHQYSNRCHRLRLDKCSKIVIPVDSNQSQWNTVLIKILPWSLHLPIGLDCQRQMSCLIVRFQRWRGGLQIHRMEVMLVVEHIPKDTPTQIGHTSVTTYSRPPLHRVATTVKRNYLHFGNDLCISCF